MMDRFKTVLDYALVFIVITIFFALTLVLPVYSIIVGATEGRGYQVILSIIWLVIGIAVIMGIWSWLERNTDFGDFV